jgi:hypothetical protein
MRKIEENLELSQLLLRHLKDELSIAEKEKVDKLLKTDVALKVMYENIRNKEYIDKQISLHSNINLDQKWDNQSRKIKQYAFRKRIVYISRIAAAILVPTLIAAYLVFNFQNSFDDTKFEFAAKVIPTSTETQLINEKGEVFELKNTNDLQIQLKSAQVKNEGNQLIYKKLDMVHIPHAKEEIHKMITAKGGEQFLILSDGTKIWVNAESEIKYPVYFVGNKRNVEIIKGEAYFEVSHDANRPFTVTTQKGVIKVLGTSFNVRAYDDEIANTTTLIEGSVSLRHKFDENSTVKLSPGQQANLINVNRKIRVSNADIESVIAWKNRQYIFKSNSLGDIFRELSHWYDFDIVFENDEIKNKKFRGRVDKSTSIIQILDILEKTQRVEFEYRDKTIKVKDI